MPRFSANLGFLWADLPLQDGIARAGKAGFDAVECHWPYGTDPLLVQKALAEADMPMLCINTSKGRPGGSDFGLAALPDRVAEARLSIDQALEYGAAINAQFIHVMAGKVRNAAAHETFLSNLSYAVRSAHNLGLTILIEPLNSVDVPGYFLGSVGEAMAIIREIDDPALKLMFDFYHAGRTEADAFRTFHEALPVIGHVQIASVPDRRAPDHGLIDYQEVFAILDEVGWNSPVGAEYRPEGRTEETLAWMAPFTSK